MKAKNLFEALGYVHNDDIDDMSAEEFGCDVIIYQLEQPVGIGQNETFKEITFIPASGKVMLYINEDFPIRYRPQNNEFWSLDEIAAIHQQMTELATSLASFYDD